MKNPTSFETSYEEAEQAAFTAMVAATHTTANKSAFLGADHNIINSWWLGSSAMVFAPEVTLAADIHSMCVNATARCCWKERALCMRWLMMLLGGINAEDSTNVARVRVHKVGAIEGGLREFGDGREAVYCWSMLVELEIVFNTGGKANRSQV